ncbi:MAG: response regulator [Planctomycetota bacterium]|nr:MAG: response regulator [Planctomycetota bacterium]
MADTTTLGWSICRFSGRIPRVLFENLWDRLYARDLIVSQETGNSRRLRVLLVDDLPADTKVMAKLLEMHGCCVRTCNDPFQCVELARQFEPHLVLLDIMMPGKSGTEVAKDLLATDLPPFLLVARTGLSDASTKAKCAEAGFNLVVIKPQSSSAIADLVRVAKRFAFAGQ